MTSNEGQNALKVEEVVIQKDEPEQEEEEVEEEKGQNEEQEQEQKDEQDQREQNDQENEVKDEDDNQNQIILKKDDNEEEEEVEENDGNPIREIRLNDEKANNFELDLSPEIKIKVGWELNDNNQVDVDFKTDSKKIWCFIGEFISIIKEINGTILINLIILLQLMNLMLLL